MPGSRVFTQQDVTGIVAGYTSGPSTTNSSVSLSSSSFSTWSLFGSGSITVPGAGGATSSANAAYSKTGTIDFQSGVNPIPDDALITRIRARIGGRISATARGTSDSVVDCSVTAALNLSTNLPSYGPDNPTGPLNGLEVVDQVDNVLVASGSYFRQLQGSDGDVIYDFEDAPINLTQLIADFGSPALFISFSPIQGFGANFGTTAFAQTSYAISIDTWELEVTWTNKYVWLINQPATNNPPTAGTVITLTSPTTGLEPGQEAVDFTEVTSMNIIFVDSVGAPVTVPVVTFTLLTPNLLTFIIPPFGGANAPSVIEIELISTQFSGSVLGFLWTVYLVSASGMYQLVMDKTSDTLYNEQNPGQTFDVKIPDPFGITGFLGK